MSNNVSSIQPTGYFQYDPLVSSYSGFDDLDLSYSTYPMMGMGGSIFDGYTSPMMPFAPGMGGNNQSYFDNMKQYQKFYNDYNIDQQKMQRNAELKVNASMEGIKGSAAILFDKIQQNEQDQISKAFKAYVDSVRNAYGDASPQEIKSRALALYSEMRGGKTLIQDLRENGHSSFIQGLLQSATFSLGYRKSTEDNISEITGQSVGTTDKYTQNAGRVVGAIGVGAAAAGITKALSKGTTAAAANTSKGIMKYLSKGSKAGKVGLIAGGLALVLSFLTGKVST